MRYFKLINHNGTEYDVTVKNRAFLFNISGLGYESENEFQRIGEHFGILSDHYAQGQIAGFVKFWQPGAEEEYFNFAQFCQNKPLTLVYSPNGQHEYMRDGVVTSIAKTDSAEGALQADIVFTAASLWYKTVYALSDAIERGEGKRYPYKYPYRYGSGATGSISIMSDSFADAPVRLIIFGPAINPAWRHYLNNELCATGKVNATIEEGRRLIIDTTGVPYSIAQYNALNELVSDLYQNSDFSTERFIRLGHGNNVISISNDAASLPRIAVEARVEYATV